MPFSSNPNYGMLFRSPEQGATQAKHVPQQQVSRADLLARDARQSLENFPDEVRQESYQQQSAGSADPEKEVGCQFRGVDFFFVHRG